MGEQVPNYFWSDLTSLVCASLGLCYFLYLIISDTWGARKRRADWIPGKALILSALTIQALSYMDVNMSVNISDEPNIWDVAMLLGNHLLIDSGRLVICVFMGYLLPGMARSGSGDQWEDILALAISLFSDIASELYFLHRCKYLFKLIHTYSLDYDFDYDFEQVMVSELQQQPSLERWYKASSVGIVVSVILLIFLLGSTIPTAYTIRGILSQTIAAALYANGRQDQSKKGIEEEVVIEVEETVSSKSKKGVEVLVSSELQKGVEEEVLKGFEEEVFKSWLVARACRPDYVIARSVLSSAAGTVVTLRIVFSLLKFKFLKYKGIILYNDGLDHLRQATLFLQGVFILVVWIAICWRWITAIVYFPKSNEMKSLFRVEGFWTRRIMEMRHRLRNHIADLKEEMLITRSFAVKFKHCFLTSAEMSVPCFLMALQTLVVLFSKFCWFLSLIVIMPIVHGGPVPYQSKQFEIYQNVLERVQMPGETAEQLLVANLKSIKQTEQRMREGRTKGEGCKDLIALINEGCVNQPEFEPLQIMEEYFPNLDKMLWKMTAVSYFRIIVALFPSHVDRAKRLIVQAGDIMNFLDRADVEENETCLLNSLDKVADQEFKKAQMKKYSSAASVLQDKIDGLVKQDKKLQEKKFHYATVEAHDDRELKEIATSYSLYKACNPRLKNYDFNVGKLMDMGDAIEDDFRNFIGYCVLQARALLVKKCREWAGDFEEDKIWEAISVAGKVKGVLENSKPQLNRSSGSQEH